MCKYSKIIFILIIASLIACSSDKNQSVELKILNKKIYFYKSQDISKPIYQKSFNYSNLSKSLKAQNNINWKVKNNTNTAYFFLMEYDKVAYLNSGVILPSEYVYYWVKNDSLNLFQLSGDVIRNDSLLFRKIDLTVENRDLNEEINEKENIKRSYTSNNYFILNPGEEVVFSSTIYLPIIQEPSMYNDFELRMLHFSDDKHEFNLNYYSNLKMYKDFLSKEDLEYLRKNNIKPFVGKLESNSVPVLPSK